jgi:hypothetical protein
MTRPLWTFSGAPWLIIKIFITNPTVRFRRNSASSRGRIFCPRSEYMDCSPSERNNIRQRGRDARKTLAQWLFGCSFWLLGQKSTRCMSRNHQGAVCCKNYSFAGFGQNKFEIPHCNVSALRAVGRAAGEKSRDLSGNAGRAGRVRSSTKESWDCEWYKIAALKML